MKKIFGLVLIAAFVTACSSKTDEMSLASMDAKMLAEEYVVEDMALNAGGSQASIDIEPQIIKTGRISIETSDAAQTKSLIYKYIGKFGGCISGESRSTYDDITTYLISVRIPAKNFDAMLDSISKSGDNVQDMSIDSQDVTEEYIDITARLKTKKELEARYLELLKKANTVKEIVAIEKEIGTLRSDIESIEGRLRYMNNAVAYSTLDISYYEQAKTFGDKLVDAFKAGWQVIICVLMAIVKLWAILLLVVAIIIIIIRVRCRRRARQNDR